MRAFRSFVAVVASTLSLVAANAAPRLPVGSAGGDANGGALDASSRRAEKLFHRAIAKPGSPAIDALLRRDAVVWAEDYGSFTLLYVNALRAGGLEAILALGLDVHDELSEVVFNDLLFDGEDPAGNAARLAGLPPFLRTPPTRPSDGESRLRVVQFVGPVKDAWLDALRATGVGVITYSANDAYVVKAAPATHAALDAFAQSPFVLTVGDYHPAYKLRSELRPPLLVDTQAYDVTVQVIADAEGAAFAQSLRARAIAEISRPERVLEYWNVGVTLDGANVLDLARDPRVFAVEPIYPAELTDERQGQIMAGQLDATGTQPGSPAYFAWLASKGLPGSGANPFSFAVDVEDDGVDRGSTTDVNTEFRVDGLAGGASRVVYNNNYSGDALADGRAGHGNINASIIGGYNNSTGTAFEDSLGYQYGLGLAPWVKIGNSKVFNNAGSGVFNQSATVRKANAYNGGARISSNSWGFTSGTTYNAESQATDASVRDALSGTAGHQELTIVFAAGNSGPGASTVHPPGTAKNILTVGASENWRMTGSDGCGVANSGADNAKDIISFSSRGPTSDQRKKPEIVAPGTHIEGAASRASGYYGTGVCNQFWPTGQTLYAWSSGTSHSTPAISGACALLRQYEINNGRPAPSPAMTKAALIAGTTYLTGVGANDTLWSNNQGMGRVNLAATFDSEARVRVDQTQVLGATGATYTTSGNVGSTSVPFRVVLAWTDAPGPTTGNAFVNNLDLEVTVDGTLYRGNVFSGASSITGGTADIRNNLESVFLPAGTSGSFSVTVRATNVAGDGVPGNADTTDQDFALLVYNGSEGTPTPDFTLSATPPTSTVTAGGNAAYTVSNAGVNGFAGNVTLSASPAISGVSYSFAPNPMAADGSSTLTVTTSAGATTGTHAITITGTSGSLVHTTGVSLTINAPATPDFTLAATPPSVTVTQGGSANYSVSNTALNGFSGSIALSASPAISGVTYSFAPNPMSAGGSATLTATTTASATTGTHSITITGTSGSLVHTTGVTLVINAGGGGGNPAKTFSVSPGLAVPDNNATGVTSTISVPDSLTVTSVSVGTTIPHSYKGDLVVTLSGPDGTSAILHNRTGGSADNVTTTFSIVTASAQALGVFTGKNTAGGWSLKVQDLAAADVGTLSAWTITFNGEKSASPALAIPDNNATGVTSTLSYAQTGTVASVQVKVGITHTYQGDLEVALIGPDGTTVLLHNRTGAGTDNINTVYPDLTVPAQALSAFTGKSISGNWSLRVRDLASVDVGTLNSWTLSLRAQ